MPPLRESPFGWLREVVVQGPRAGGPLVAWVCRHPELRAVEARQRTDVAHDVALKLLVDAEAVVRTLTRDDSEGCAAARPPGALARADARLRAYVRAMIRHRGIDLARQERRVVRLDDAAEDGFEPSDPQASAERDPITAAMNALDLAVDTAGREGGPELVRTLAEVSALARGEVAMDDLVGGGSASRRRRARARLYKQHERARATLGRVLGELLLAGLLAADDAEHAALLVDLWLRRRQSKRSS